MSQKRLKARDLVEACLDRIKLREGQVHAWEAIDAEGALKRAGQHGGGKERRGFLDAAGGGDIRQ